MTIASTRDFERAARARLPRFLFDYAAGGAFDEQTLARNVADLQGVALRQRVLRKVADLDLSTELFGKRRALPLALGPVGIAGMYARRGETQAARAATRAGIPFTLSTVSLCSLAEVMAAASGPIWFQLYVIRDRSFMRDLIAQAHALGAEALVFTVDMPVPGIRYRDQHSGMSGRFAPQRRLLQAITHPRWMWDVGVRGRPHRLGNLTAILGKRSGLRDYIGWLGANFDPSIGWGDLEWIASEWGGPLIIKGVLDAEDARAAAGIGAKGVVVSNHGGRQLDGVLSSARALPAVADAVGGDLLVLADSGVRTGLDIVRLLALGADAVLLGRSWLYALAAHGEAGVSHLLQIIAREMEVAMTLTGVARIGDIDSSIVASARQAPCKPGA